MPVYKAALEKQGRPYKGLFIFRDLCIADSTREAEDRIREGYERRYLRYQQWGQPGERYDLKFDELKRDRLILGSPAEVVEQVMSYYEEFNTEVMWFMVDWPGDGPALDFGNHRAFRRRGDSADQSADAAVPTAVI